MSPPFSEADLESITEKFIRAVAIGDWESVEPMVAQDFVTSEVLVSPDWLIESFGDRDWSSVAPILAEEFVAGKNEMNYEDMVDDLDDHYRMFEPTECLIENISIEQDTTAVYRLTHIETHVDVYVGMEPSGEEVAYEELGVLRFEDGLVTERRVTLDLDAFHVQLGIRPGRTDVPVSKRGTQVKVQQQFYRVLNRLLRHNIRNDLTYVRGYAEVLADSSDDMAERAEGIIDFADDLINTAEKVRILEENVLKPEEDHEINVVEVTRAVIEGIRADYPAAEIDFVPPQESITILSNEPILEIVLEEAIENAINHNDARESWVELEIELDDPEFAAVFRVADNGPGIPEHELKPLTQEVETALEHASGIGLWAIKWGVEQLGGDVEFERREPQGSIVRMSITDFRELG